MLTQFKDISSWRKHDLTIKPHEVYTLNFRDTLPNIFVVNNANMATLKIGISSIPRVDSYEFKVEYNTNETLGRPIGTNNIYILNDSSVTVKIVVFSIEKEFDPVILKNMNISLYDQVIESSSEISGVKDGIKLPVTNDDINLMLSRYTNPDIVSLFELLTELKSIAGNMTNMISNNTNLNSIVEAINNKEIVLSGDGITLNGVATDMTQTNSLLSQVANAVKSQDCNENDTLLTGIKDVLITTNENINTLKTLINDVKTLNSFNNSLKCEKGSDAVYKNKVTSFNYTASSDCFIHFDWLFNDGGESNISLNNTNIFTMLEGESYSEMRFKLKAGDVLKISGSNASYRLKYWLI